MMFPSRKLHVFRIPALHGLMFKLKSCLSWLFAHCLSVAGQNLKQIVQIRFRCGKSICTYITWKCFDISHKVQEVASCPVLWVERQKTTELLKKKWFSFCVFHGSDKACFWF